MKSTAIKVQKPTVLRIIFILNAILMLLPFIFYYIITKNQISIQGIHPIWMIYTGIAYTSLFIGIVISIVKKKLKILRVLLLTIILVSFPAKAIIGMLIGGLSILLSFTRPVQQYFS